jgi:murein DD-endopeptidase MepM/ murein hydrolase activator NlpD
MKFSRPTLLPILWYGEPDQGYSTMRVTFPFAQRDDGFHGALDIGNFRAGDTLIAPAAGKVIAAGYLGYPWSQPTTRFPSGNYGGLMVVIEHEPGVVSIFAHMRMRAVSVGQRVVTGQKIGEVGDTGSAQGAAHVHFGIQAPANRVPTGVATHATSLGYGLDIDPWPLITGQAELTAALPDTALEDNDMPLITGLVQARLGRGNNIRAAATTAAPILKQTTETIWVDVAGIVKDQGPWSLSDGTSGVDWYEIEAYGRRGYVAVALLPDLQLTTQGADLIPPRTVIVTEKVIDQEAIDQAVGQALAELNARIDAAQSGS